MGTQRYRRVPAPPRPTSFLLSPEELSSLETNSLLLKLSLMLLAGDLVEDKDLEAAPFFSALPFVCFSCFFFFFFDLSLRARRRVTPTPRAQDAPHPLQGPRHRDSGEHPISAG